MNYYSFTDPKGMEGLNWPGCFTLYPEAAYYQ